MVKQLDEILLAYNELKAKSKYDDLSELHESDFHRTITQSRAAIVRITGIISPYSQQVNDILARESWDSTKMISLIGVVEALKKDIEADYLQTTEELIHGELFSDLLEMASHLLNEGYKDPAAVVCGASLESHLRQLSKKLGIETTSSTPSGEKPKKSDSLNAEITKASGYSILDQKNVTAWLDLRNKAAHGYYETYTSDQVTLMISGVRDFITRNPA